MKKGTLGSEFAKNLQLLIEEKGYIRLMGIKIRSVREMMQFKIIAAAGAFFLLFTAGYFTGKNFLAYSAVLGVVIFFLPSEIVKGGIAFKSRKVLGELPDTIDLMASLLKAGLTLDECIIYIIRNLNGEIPGLLSFYHTKMLDGFTRAEAYDTAGRLSFCYEFKSFTKLLYQSETIGNPISEVLKDLSRVYRNNQRDYLKIRAERLESNLIIVVFIFIFIPMLALFLIPVLPQIKMIAG